MQGALNLNFGADLTPLLWDPATVPPKLELRSTQTNSPGRDRTGAHTQRR
jgi:hypothetical protein